MSFASGPSIRIDHLFVRYPERSACALCDLTAEINPGAAVALTGPSGCGKTTLLRALAGFIPEMIRADVSGSIHFDGSVDVGTDPMHPRPSVGLVQQDPDAQVCTLRVRSEVAFGPENLCLPRSVVDRRVQQAMDVMGIAHLANRDTTTLSGGEKQRLAVASILAMEPPVLLLDEPTAHLDPAGAQALFEQLRHVQHARKRSLVIAEHRLAPLAMLAPQLWVLDSGRRVRREPGREHVPVERLLQRARRKTKSEQFPIANVLDVAELTFSYGGPGRLIEGLNVSIRPGTVHGIIGPNGGGKTTLLRLLAGLEHPDGGRIVRHSQARPGMVFQHPHQQIFEQTVRRDLEIEGSMSDADVRAALHSARLAGTAARAPHSLSLGEQRRLTVLSAFRNDPEILLLDEPFIGQDRENVLWIVERIVTARDRGAAVVLVTHDIPLADALCDRLLYLGDTVLEGVPSEVFGRLRDMGRAAFTPAFWEEGNQ